MGTSSLRLFLQSLCCNSPWNYAMFWKLQHQSQLLLTWEDGYVDVPRRKELVDSFTNDFYLQSLDEELYSNYVANIHNGVSTEYTMEQVMAKMSKINFLVGKGIVGEVACTGNPCWIFSDQIAAGQFNLSVFSQCADEWLHQFLAGIKTVLLVPVIPHGVLQLGSSEMVPEDAVLVAYLKDKFEAHKKFDGYYSPFRSHQESLTWSAELLNTRDDLNNSAAVPTNKINADLQSLASVSGKVQTSSTENKRMPSSTKRSCTDVGLEVLGQSDNTSRIQSIDIVNVVDPLNNQCNIPEMIKTNVPKSFVDKIEASSYLNDYNESFLAEQAKEVDFYIGGVTESLLPANGVDSSTFRTSESHLSFPKDCELRKALGPSIPDTTGQSLQELSAATGISSADNPNYNTVASPDMLPSAWEADGWFIKDDISNLLEAIVANACNNSSDGLPSESIRRRSIQKSSDNFVASVEGRSHWEKFCQPKEDASLGSCLTSVSFSDDRHALSLFSPSASSFGSMISSLMEDQQQKKGHAAPYQRKGSKLSNSEKRRNRNGDSQKPRPRDRQLIQDRIKELRELVPHGAKCSIDSLLDRTIKHMVFLRNVSDQAGKLREHVLGKDPDEKSPKSSNVKSGHQQGSSWAVELGSEEKACPIIVKDLDFPGHMLIEMVCDDHGHFLEIVDVIHRLELTILKGVMERRSDNTWAHFIIEASKGFHRLDIFWPLMQLLQRNCTPISSKI